MRASRWCIRSSCSPARSKNELAQGRRETGTPPDLAQGRRETGTPVRVPVVQMKKITIRDHVRFQPDKMAKVALGATERALLDLYCVAPGQRSEEHTSELQSPDHIV